jgi:hypothetical protein
MLIIFYLLNVYLPKEFALKKKKKKLSKNFCYYNNICHTSYRKKTKIKKSHF